MNHTTSLYLIIAVLLLSVCALGIITYQQQNYIESINAKSTKDTRRITALKANIKDLDTRISYLSNDIDELKSSVDDIESVPSPTSTYTYDSDISDIEMRIGVVEQELDSLDYRLD